MNFRRLLAVSLTGLALHVAMPSNAVTLSREPDPQREKASPYTLGDTNAPLVVGIAGMEFLPEDDAGASAAISNYIKGVAGSEEDALNAELMDALLRRLHSSGAGGKFAADGTTSSGPLDGATSEELTALVAGEEALAAIESLQQSGVVAVPEPSTYALLGAGAALLALKARRRKI